MPTLEVFWLLALTALFIVSCLWGWAVIGWMHMAMDRFARIEAALVCLRQTPEGEMADE